MTPSRYDSALLLSGGKDSTYLAYRCCWEGRRTLAITVDVGFMSQAAKDNIEQVQQELKMDHLWVRSQQSQHARIIEEFRNNPKQGLQDVCGACTAAFIKTAVDICVRMNIKHLFGGHTKYLANALGFQAKRLQYFRGFLVEQPYMEEYNLNAITTLLEARDYVTDPTLTNCQHIREIIRTHEQRFGVNPYEAEFGGLLADGQITQAEYDGYKRWCSQ